MRSDHMQRVQQLGRCCCVCRKISRCVDCDNPLVSKSPPEAALPGEAQGRPGVIAAHRACRASRAHRSLDQKGKCVRVPQLPPVENFGLMIEIRTRSARNFHLVLVEYEHEGDKTALASLPASGPAPHLCLTFESQLSCKCVPHHFRSSQFSSSLSQWPWRRQPCAWGRARAR